MPYEPTRGVYRFIDEELDVPRQFSGHRPKQVIPRKDIVAEAKRQAEREARARNLRGNSRVPPDAYPKVRQRAAREDDEFYEDEDLYTQRPPRSAVRYQPEEIYRHGNTQVNKYTSPPPVKARHAIPPRQSASAQQVPAQSQQYERLTNAIDEQETERVRPRRRPKIHFHPLVWLGLGMIAMIFLWVGYSNVLNWWQIHQDDSIYGRPRTFQIDAVVGHNDSTANPSHFIALNLNRHVMVIELPGGDPTKARIYPVTTLFGDGQELTPATISFKDVDGDGLVDMEIHIENQTLVMINENGGFRPLKAGERVHL
jgi:hypothetical protein